MRSGSRTGGLFPYREGAPAQGISCGHCSVLRGMFTNDTTPGASTVFVVALLAVAMAALVGTAAHAQTVPATAGAATSLAGDESAPSPEVDEAAPPWYLKGRFLMGAAWGTVATIDKNLGTQHRVSPFFSWNSRRRGWGPSFGFSSTTTDLRVPVEARATAIGSVRIRPLVAGVAYSLMNGRTRTSLGVVGGYSFNHALVDRALPPGVGVDVTVQNAWVAQPKVDVMFAATRRLALIASFGYTFANPDVSVTVTQGGQPTFRASDHVRVDSVAVRVGAAVSLF